MKRIVHKEIVTDSFEKLMTGKPLTLHCRQGGNHGLTLGQLILGKDDSSDRSFVCEVCDIKDKEWYTLRAVERPDIDISKEALKFILRNKFKDYSFQLKWLGATFLGLLLCLAIGLGVANILNLNPLMNLPNILMLVCGLTSPCLYLVWKSKLEPEYLKTYVAFKTRADVTKAGPGDLTKGEEE